MFKKETKSQHLQFALQNILEFKHFDRCVCVSGGSITARQKLKEKRKDKMIERCSAEAGGRASYIGGKCQ